MQSEAAEHDLCFKSGDMVDNPEDVRSGRMDSMTRWWRAYEILPVRQQVSFSGTGRNEPR